MLMLLPSWGGLEHRVGYGMTNITTRVFTLFRFVRACVAGKQVQSRVLQHSMKHSASTLFPSTRTALRLQPAVDAYPSPRSALSHPY